MFEARYPNGTVLKKLFDVMNGLVSDIALVVSPTGISLQAMDDSHVALVTFTLHSHSFEPYRCDHPLNIALKMSSLNKVMKTIGATDELTILAEDDVDTATFVVSPEGGNAQNIGGSESRFKLFQCELENDALSIPDQEYKASFQMPASMFQRVCRDLSAFGESVQISVTKTFIQLTTNGAEGECVKTVHRTNRGKDEEAEVGDVNIALAEPMTMTFALQFLTNFSKAASISPDQRVTVRMSHEAPICVEFDLPNRLGFLCFYLAPKVDNDAE